LAKIKSVPSIAVIVIVCPDTLLSSCFTNQQPQLCNQLYYIINKR